MHSFLIAGNLIKRVLSDKKGLLTNLLLPVLVVSLIVYFTGNSQSVELKVGVANLDRGILGETLHRELSQMSQVKVAEMSEEDLKQHVRDRKVHVGIVIPADFSRQLLEEKRVHVQSYQSLPSELAISLEQRTNLFIGQLVRTVKQVKALRLDKQEEERLLADILEKQTRHNVASRVTDYNWYVPERMFLVIGFLLFFLMNMILNAIAVVLEDRRAKTMDRLYAAPVRPFEAALGYFLGVFTLGAMQILLVLIITVYGLHYNYQVPFGELFLILTCFLLAVVAIGSAVAGLVKRSDMMSPISSVIITPTCMLGGCWWPYEIMPDFLQKAANFVPQKWTLQAITELAAGANLPDVTLHIGILLLFAFVFLGFGSIVLRPAAE